MGRYWQTLLLSRWKGIFAWLPVETIVKKHQQEYYKAIAQSDAKGDSTDFIVFMLKCILQTISEQQKVTDDVGTNVGINEQRVLDALHADASLSAVKIGQLLGITTRQAERLLASLREKNLIRRIGANKNGHWEIVQC